MTPDTAQGVSAELNFVLKEGWSFKQHSDRFRVRPPPGSQAGSDFKELLRSEVWRIAQFVAYGHFVSIERQSSGAYIVVSRSESGSEFELVFETG